MKQIVAFLCGFFSCVSLFAVPATPDILTVNQADGTTLQYRLIGDEYGSVMTTLDNFVVMNTARGLCYATQNESGMYVATDVLAHNSAQRDADELAFVEQLKPFVSLEHNLPTHADMRRSAEQRPQLVGKKSYPLKNSPRSLVILVNYTDVKFTISNAKQAFTDLLNQSGYKKNGGTGSARDYFIASSDSAFSPIFDVYGPYDLPNNQAYYGAPTSYANDIRPEQMITQACALAVEAGVDLKQYDTDNDGYVDNVFVYYAGHNQAEGASANTVWPHRFYIQNSPDFGGCKIYDYACTSELRGHAGTSMCGIGTFCHEFGHVLGLADLYDTKNDYAYTLGTWDVMCSGSYNNAGRTPPSYSSFERFMLGWLVPEQIERSSNYLLEPLATSNKAYLLAAQTHNLVASGPNPKEYFLLENRQNLGWDAGYDALVGTGMLVWHINYNAARWNSNVPNNGGVLDVDIVEAYNKTPTTSSPSDTYPGTRDVTNMIPSLRSGEEFDYPVSNIRQLEDGTITFALKGGDGSGFSFSPTTLPEFKSTYETENYETSIEYATNELLILGNRLDPNDAIEITLRNNFQLSLDSMKTWQTAAILSAKADSTLSKQVWIRYAPNRQNCSTTTGSLVIKNSEYANTMAFSGSSPNPQHVTTPVVNEADEITPYSFRMNWEAQKAASAYYITLYQINDTRSEIRQGFEEFTSLDNIEKTGWEANFVLPTTVTKSEGVRAVMFKETGNMLCSERYSIATTAVDFWLSASYSGNGDSIGGMMYFTAFDGKSWVGIDTIDIRKTSKDMTKSYQFDLEQNYIQFRFEYQHRGGTGGVALDDYIATFDKQITYIYRNKEKEIYVDDYETNPKNSVQITGLTPETTYYYQVQSSDVGKGCREHLTDLSEPKSVTTLAGAALDDKQLTIVYENGRYVVYLPEADVNRYIFVYSIEGLLMAKIPIESASQSSVILPVMPNNLLYTVKYSEEGYHKRKDKWGKFFYQ